ncbi:MAG: hypothetical protein JWP29_5194 [Rhodoferax sp.]|nr:hypothetical protein [Rhodoferax sp.]
MLFTPQIKSAARPEREHPDDDRPQHADREGARSSVHPRAARGAPAGRRAGRDAARAH